MAHREGMRQGEEADDDLRSVPSSSPNLPVFLLLWIDEDRRSLILEALGAARAPARIGATLAPPMRPLVYATRRSMLALAQCRAFVARLCQAAPELETRELQVVTTGDRIQERPLADIGGKGLFVKEIEEALLDGRADFAVHSIKDVPGSLPPGLILACIPERADPRDVLVAPRHGTLDALLLGARVGTSSLRRMMSIQARRPDLQVVPMRGNVDTRLRKVDAGECDAIVLARAGLLRLGMEDRATEVLDADLSLPAVGQGALGIECREDDAETRTALAQVNDAGKRNVRGGGARGFDCPGGGLQDASRCLRRARG